MLFRSLAGASRSRTDTKLCLVRFDTAELISMRLSILTSCLDGQALILRAGLRNMSGLRLFCMSTPGPGGAEVTKTKKKRDRHGKIEYDLLNCHEEVRRH